MKTLVIAMLLGAAAAPVGAAETITYKYDVHGRLVAVVQSGTVNNGIQKSYTHDNANNRTNVTVTGASR